MTYGLDLQTWSRWDWVEPPRPRYLGQKSFCLKVIIRTHEHYWLIARVSVCVMNGTWKAHICYRFVIAICKLQLLLHLFDQESVSGASGRRCSCRCKWKLTSEDSKAIHACHGRSWSTFWSVTAADCWPASWPEQSGKILHVGSFLRCVICLRWFAFCLQSHVNIFLHQEHEDVWSYDKASSDSLRLRPFNPNFKICLHCVYIIFFLHLVINCQSLMNCN